MNQGGSTITYEPVGILGPKKPPCGGGQDAYDNVGIA